MREKSIIILGIILVIIAIGLFWIKIRPISHPTSTNEFPNPPTATQAPAIANPAAVNCIKKGGKEIIQKRGDGGQYGLCDFGDNMACEEWALLNGNCPVGGLKTTGYDAIEQKYCAWLGGKTVAQPNATCTLPSGIICDDKKLYDGTCPAKNTPAS